MAGLLHNSYLRNLVEDMVVFQSEKLVNSENFLIMSLLSRTAYDSTTFFNRKIYGLKRIIKKDFYEINCWLKPEISMYNTCTTYVILLPKLEEQL